MPTENFILPTEYLTTTERKMREKQEKKNKRTLLQFSFYYHLAFAMKFFVQCVGVCMFRLFLRNPMFAAIGVLYFVGDFFLSLPMHACRLRNVFSA